LLSIVTYFADQKEEESQ